VQLRVRCHCLLLLGWRRLLDASRQVACHCAGALHCCRLLLLLLPPPPAWLLLQGCL
jgi:hypothetical protein